MQSPRTLEQRHAWIVGLPNILTSGVKVTARRFSSLTNQFRRLEAVSSGASGPFLTRTVMLSSNSAKGSNGGREVAGWVVALK